jgi:hypothetical protein
LATLLGQLGSGEDVGGVVQVAVGVTADELAVRGEGDIALDDAL